MLAKLERLFSGTKTIITDRKNCLSIKNIKIIECFKSWLSKGNIVAFVDDVVDIRLLNTGSNIL